MKNQRKAFLFTTLSILCWSTVASAFKITLRYITPIELLALASLTSTVVLFLLLTLQKKLHLLRTLTPADLGLSLAMGVLSPFLYYLFVFRAYELLPAQQAQPLNMIWGIVIVILSAPLLGQKVGPRTLLALLIAFSGVIVLSTEGDIARMNIKEPLGVGLALASSIFWSLYWLLNTRDRRDPLLRLFLNFCFGTVFVWTAMVLFHPLRPPPLAGLLGGMYAGVFEMGLTFYFWLQALKFSRTTAKVSILVYIVPFLSLVLIHRVVGEAILPASVAGLILIVGGILLEQTGRNGPGRPVVKDAGREPAA